MVESLIVLVTGVCGFVGSAIANVLHRAGNQIIGIDRSDDYICESLDKYYKCDISNEDDIDHLLKLVPKCDVVVHVAAIISFNSFNVNMMQVNCIGTLQIGRFALATGAKQIVYISSVPIIGKPQVIPITEDNNDASPQTLYHLTKFVGEKVLQLPEFNKISVSIFRLSSPISPSMSQNRMLPLFLKKALCAEPVTLHGSGSRIQNYVDTRDVAKAVWCAINKNKSGLFLIGGQSMSNKEVAIMCNEICHSSAGIQYSGKLDLEEEYHWIISNYKSGQELGYSPEYSVKDTLTEMKKIMKNVNE